MTIATAARFPIAHEFSVSDKQSRRCFSTASYRSRHIYIIGGFFNDGTETNEVLVFSLTTNSFSDGPLLNEARSTHSSTSSGNIVAVIGGNGIDCKLISSIEVLNVVEDTQW